MDVDVVSSVLKLGFMGPSLTDAKCHGDIYPGNICPSNICPYQEYLSCYWHNFDHTFLTQSYGALNFVDNIFLDQTFFDQNIFGTKKNIYQQFPD